MNRSSRVAAGVTALVMVSLFSVAAIANAGTSTQTPSLDAPTTLAVTSVPLSFLGARVALRTDARRLERGYGVALAGLGAVFLALL